MVAAHAGSVSYEQDTILRLARQLAGLVARLLRLGKAGATPQALEELEQAYGDLFGVPPGLMETMTPEDLARFLRGSGRVDLAVTLMETEVTLLEQAGRGREAEWKRDRLARLRAAS